MEDWFWGPHDPKARSAVGALSWAVVHSTYWEYLFLMYILFNAVLKLTYRRIQVRLYFVPPATRVLLFAMFYCDVPWSHFFSSVPVLP
jgi:hypothetical protein